MAITQKTNHTAPATIVCKQSAQVAYEGFVAAAETMATATLAFVAAGANYLLVVNHYADKSSKDYLEIGKARETLQKYLEGNTGLKAAMLYRYVQYSAKIADAIRTGRAHVDTVKAIANAKDANAARDVILKWLSTSYGVTSLNALVRKTTTTPPPDKRPQSVKVAARVENTFKAIERDFDNVRPATVAQAVVNAAPDNTRLAIVTQAINQLTDVAMLEAIRDAAEKHIADLKRLAKAAQESVAKQAAQASKGAKAPAKIAKAKARTKVRANA